MRGGQGFLETQEEIPCLFQLREAAESHDFWLRLVLKGSNGRWAFSLLFSSGPAHLFSLPHPQLTVSAIPYGPTQISQSIFSAS